MMITNKVRHTWYIYEHINDDNKQSMTYMVQYEHINDYNKQSMTYMIQYEHINDD